jgi:hypothetical protein
VDAKNRYLQARKILENDELALAQERMKAAVAPNRGGVKIWEKAEAPDRPSSINLRTLFDALFRPASR